MKNNFLFIARSVVRNVPAVLPYLAPQTRYALAQPIEYKTFEYYLAALRGLVSSVYNGFIAGEFIDTMANLVSGQLRDAFERAWFEDGNLEPMPDYLESALEEMILSEYERPAT